MQARRFIQCDVFTPVPTLGNALAVVVDGDGLSEQAMQQFAAWTNLAETTFILPPQGAQADYRLKIFTPVREMLFAGHPTLGSCAAWLHCGGAPQQSDRVRQECGIGIVEIDISNPGMPAFIAPPTRIRHPGGNAGSHLRCAGDSARANSAYRGARQWPGVSGAAAGLRRVGAGARFVARALAGFQVDQCAWRAPAGERM